MVCLILNGLNGRRAARALRCTASGDSTAIGNLPRSAVAAFAQLLATTDATHIAWLDERLAESVLPAVATWPGLLQHDLEMLHSGAQTEPRIATLAFACPTDHALIPAVPGRRYPTHLCGSVAGIASVALLRAVGPDTRYRSLSAMLSDIAWRGRAHGLLPHQEPALPSGPPPHNVPRSDVAALIARNLDTRWLGLWLLGYLRFFWWLPLISAIGAVLRRRPAALASAGSIRALHPPLDQPDEADGIDVIIPTLGRPGPLADVLQDLAAQTETPQRVIVVEQVPQPDWPLLPDDVLERSWPFELVHRRITQTGACLARNIALAEVRSAWVAMLDDDVRLDDNWLRTMRRTLKRYGVEAGCGRVVEPGTPPDTAPPGPPHGWGTFGTCAGFVSSRCLASAGGTFDMGLEGGWGEDQEIGMRFRLAGSAILLEPTLRVLHLKAPMGGFRAPRVHPWSADRTQPKPAPTMLLFVMRHAPPLAMRGYRQFYAVNRLLRTPLWKWPVAWFRIRRELRAAIHWATWLSQQHICPVVEPA